MKLTDLFLGELDREARVTRRALENVPDPVDADWRPHPRSMAFGYLVNLIAMLPSWIVLTIEQDQLDLDPPGGKNHEAPALRTRDELLEAFDGHVESARKALQNTTDEHLMTNWKLLVQGKVVADDPRHIVLRDSVMNHLAHHRGQLTVYLRLNDARVPSIYGPSADEPAL